MYTSEAGTVEHGRSHDSTTGPRPHSGQRAAHERAAGGRAEDCAPGHGILEAATHLPIVGRVVSALIEPHQKAHLVDRMLAHDARTPPITDAERHRLSGSLGRVDTDVLRYAQEHGVKFTIARPGEDMRDLNVLQEYHPERDMPKLEHFADRLDARVSGLDERIGALDAKIDARHAELLREVQAGERKPEMPAIGMLGGGPQDKELARLWDEKYALDTRKRRVVSAALKDSGQGLVPIPPYQSVNDLARDHGARTPQDIARYTHVVGGINGERLKQAQAEGLRDLREQARTNPAARKKLEEALRDPGEIPLVHSEGENLLAPDYNLQHEGSRDFWMNAFNERSLVDWGGPDGRVDTREQAFERRSSVVTGEYYEANGDKRILLRSDALADETPIHELGHAVEDAVSKDDPAFYRGWSERRDRAFEAAGESGRAISRYSLTNTHEYLAEGFANYYTDPKLLKHTDPALFELIEEITHHAGDLSREDELADCSI